MIILNEIVMKIHIALKTRLRFVSQNASMAKSLIESPNSTRDWNVSSSLTFGFLEEAMKKVISEF